MASRRVSVDSALLGKGDLAPKTHDDMVLQALSELAAA
jgi:hypothetical protein